MPFISKLLERIDKLAVEKPVCLAGWIAVFVMVVVVGASWNYWFCDRWEFLKNVAVEAHGMVFDLFVIGWFVLWLNKRAEKRLDIRRYEEEIDDYRHWKEAEATHRIIGSIKRLKRNGVTDINLSHCFLQNAMLMKIDLSEADLTGADLKGAALTDAKLSGAHLNGAKLEKVDLSGANLDGAHLDCANLCLAKLSGTSLNGAKLIGADLSSTDFYNANFGGADLTYANFSGSNLYISDLKGATLSGANFYCADLEDVKNWTKSQLQKAVLCETKLPRGCDLDPDKDCDLLGISDWNDV